MIGGEPKYRVVDVDPVDDREKPWWRAGFAPSQSEAWFRAGRYLLATDEVLEPPLTDVIRVAQTWAIAGFTPEEVRGWRDILTECEGPSDVLAEARRWRAAGFDPDTAAPWLRPGPGLDSQPLELAVLFANKGWHTSVATLMTRFMYRLNIADRDEYRRAWLNLDINASDVLDFIKAGVTPEEAATLLKSRDKEHLREELRARAAALPPVDGYTAMWINHINFLGDPDEQYTNIFHREHLPDLHDERYEEDEQDRREEERHRILGPPDEQGVHVVAVVEFSDDASEDQWSNSGNMLAGSLHAAAVRLGFERRDIDVPDTWESPAFGTLPDGTVLAAIRTQVRAPSWHLISRDPTEEERARWADPGSSRNSEPS